MDGRYIMYFLWNIDKGGKMDLSNICSVDYRLAD